MTFTAIKDLVADNAGELWQFAGYVAVSGCALAVDMSVYWALLNIAHYAFLAAVGGYICGVLSHYALSSRIVFRNRFDKRGVAEEAPTVVKFFAAGVSGLIVTAIVVGVLADILDFHPLIAKIAAAGCSFTVVFLCMRLFVFNARPRARPSITTVQA